MIPLRKKREEKETFVCSPGFLQFSRPPSSAAAIVYLLFQEKILIAFIEKILIKMLNRV